MFLTNRQSKILSLVPVAYLPLDDQSGTTARNAVNPLHVGTYSSVTLANHVSQAGAACPRWDGVNDDLILDTHVNAYLPKGVGTSGTIICWFRVLDSAIWTDGLDHYIFRVIYQSASGVSCRKPAANSRLSCVYGDGTTSYTMISSGTPVSYTGDQEWHMVAVVWDGARCSAYHDGLRYGPVAARQYLPTGTYVGSVGRNYDGTESWDGLLSDFAVFNRALRGDEIQALAKG